MIKIDQMKKTITRAVKGLGSLLPRGQRGVVDTSILTSLLLTLLALANNGFDINYHPELGTKLKAKCSNMDQLTDPAAIKACADAMIQVAATGLLENENTAGGLVLLGLSDASGVDLGLNPYTIIFDPRPGTFSAGMEHTVEIKVIDKNEDLNTKDVPVAVSVAGSNGYTGTFSGKAGFSLPYYLTIPAAPGGTIFTITVIANPASFGSVTKTFTLTVPHPPSYTGPFQVQGIVKKFINYNGTQYTCSCTLVQTGTMTATIDYVANDSTFGGKVAYTDSRGTLSSCVTTPPDINACSPDYSGESWPLYLNNLYGIIAGTIPDVAWSFNDYGGPCTPLTTFSGTIDYYTSISGTVNMTPIDPASPYCAVEGITSQFKLQRNK